MLDIRNKFFMMRMMKPWHRLPREMSYPGNIQGQVGQVLSNLV